ncbi:phospholipase/carboxylesterase [Nostoc carneum NIES-2107]|nr:phospholipase/carboxylesterase [Nostoc carneum NIES-2107]
MPNAQCPMPNAQNLKFITVTTLGQVKGQVDFTLLPDGDHFIADEVYSNPQLQQWLISQSRRASVAV